MPLPCKPLPAMSDKDIERFLGYVYVRRKDECWPWMACILNTGYGRFMVNRHGLGAHRVAYYLHHGKDAYPWDVLHSCDTRDCCNGFHLFAGTYLDNIRDCVTKGRQARGNSHGKIKLTESDTAQIRHLYARGWSTGRIAERFDVRYWTIWRIATGRDRIGT